MHLTIVNKALIAAKIWWSEYQARDLIRSRTLSPVIKIVVESGAIYSITLICLLVSYLCGSWAHYVFLDMVGHSILYYMPLFNCI